MQNIYKKIRLSVAAITVAFLGTVSVSQAQIAESFEGTMNTSNGLPDGWKLIRLNGTNGLPNSLVRVNNAGIGTYPSATVFNGAYALKYNSRNVAYPNYNSSVTAGNDKVLLVSRSLDWSGRDTATGANVSRLITFRFYRDASTTGSVNNANDNIEVYLNDRTDTIGAVLLTETSSNATSIPRSSTLAPTFTGSGWQLLRYTIPAQVPGTGGSKFDTTSSAYVIIKFTSNSNGVGGNNMLIDSLSVPEWKTQMVVTHATLIFKNTNPVLPGSNLNNVAGIKIFTKGSLSPVKVDRFVCYQSGSTDYPHDVTNSRCYYTHDSTYFKVNSLELPHSSGSNTLPPLDFGYWTSPCTMTTPAAYNLNPGSENYVWLSLDISAVATPDNIISITPGFVYAAGNCATPVNVVNTSAIILNIDNDLQYPPPVFQYGTSFLNYSNNDFISAVNMVGENGTELDNWYHNESVAGCNQNCDRFSTHPNDYTFFTPANLGSHKNRSVAVTMGRGVRLPNDSILKFPYELKIAAGTNAKNNFIHVWIDWNQDGDFNDVYYTNYGFQTDSIFENLGSVSMDAGDMVNPFGAKFGNWLVNVPMPKDTVIDKTKISGSNTAIKPGMVRMRIIETNGTAPNDPTGSYLYGETEDYSITVVGTDICPAANSNTCRWLGVNKEWNDVANWCPAPPTLNDIAYIPALSGFAKYPVIDSGTVAQCRSLKIADGAHVSIENAQGGTLKVADSLIIGVRTLTANSYLKVSSGFNKSITIPGESSAPPSGTGYVPQSIFQTVPNLKIQIAYSASELANNYGWKPGDIIDSLRFIFKSTNGAAVTFNNYRIVKYEVSNPVSWTNPSPINTDIAVRSGYAGLTSGPTYVLGSASAGVTLTMNVPNDGVSDFGVALNSNSFIWNGNNLVLSFEYWAPSTAGLGNYTLYSEASAVNNVLTLKSNTGAISANVLLSGYQLSGYNRSLISPFNSASIVSTGVQASYCATNLRPRINFAVHRNYSRFPIIVGKAFVNNNPTGIIAGANGFIAGNSSVSFDPTMRTLVSSPGLSQTDSVINPTPQLDFLALDTMVIASGWPGVEGAAQTFFNELIVRATDNGPAYSLKQRLESYADYLTLLTGEFNLNRNTFTLLNSKASSLSTYFGWIRSENGTGTINSIFMWKIGSDTGTYNVPFGLSKNNIYPLTYKAIAGDVGDLSLATYKTTNTNNTILPVSPVTVLNMNNLSNFNVGDSCVDRFWMVQRNTFGPITNSVTFRYNNTNEGTTKSAYAMNQMKVIRYAQYGVNWRWCRTSNWPNQTDVLNGSIGAVTVALNDSIKSNNWLIYSVQKATCVAATPTVTNSGALTFCNGDSVTLTSSAATAYKWSNGQTNNSITVKSTGTYTVTAYNATGCSANSAGVVVTVNNKPQPTVTASGSTTFCNGDSITLTCANAAGYLWSTGATSKTITVKTAATYYVTATNAVGCTAVSTGVVVTVKSKPSATISLSGPSTFCQGGSVVLTCSAASSYLWSTGATNQSISATTTGTYTVTATNAFGCTRASSGKAVTVNPLPTATITASGPLTFCNGDSVILNANSGGTLAYQWRKNGSNITNAVNATYTTKVAGSYLVVVTNNNGCSKTSNSLTVTVNCREGELAALPFNMYPNPANGLVYVEMKDIAAANATFAVTDIAGRLVEVNAIKVTGSMLYFDASNLAEGAYTVVVRTENETIQKILIVARN